MLPCVSAESTARQVKQTSAAAALAAPQEGQIIALASLAPSPAARYAVGMAASMSYVRLGRSGVQVSRLCLGCMSYGDPGWRPWVLDEEAARPHFRKALDLGINFFDTADMYSRGRSEEVTGRMLKEMASRHDYVLATKVFFPAEKKGPNREGLSRKHILEACDASLRR